MELTLCAGRAVSHDVCLSVPLLLVLDEMGYPFAGVFDALTLLPTQHGSHFPFRPGVKG
jgi:hypothetical protein